MIFYILLELQSKVDFQMPYRLLVYMNEIWRDVFINTDVKERSRKAFRLPAIIPIVLYNGEDNWTVPLEFKEMLQEAPMFEDQVLNFKYLLLDINRYEKVKLLQLSNLVGSVFYLDQTLQDKQEIFTRLNELIDVLKQLNQEEFSLFKTWLKHIVSRRFPEEHQKEMEKVIGRTNTKGVDDMISNFGRSIEKFTKESMEEGEKRKAIEIAKNLLNDGMPTDLIAKYTGLTHDEVKQIKQEKS